MSKYNLDKLREIAEPRKLTRAEEMALEAYPRDEDRELNFRRTNYRIAYERGYKQAEKDIISIIESRISEILGDAQPKPVLRIELQELIKRITEAKK